jgi:hypothetical protein
MSSRPKRSTAASTIAWADLVSLTSALTAVVLGPAIFTVSPQSLTSAAMTLALARASVSTKARPMPRAAPVTIATLPSSMGISVV